MKKWIIQKNTKNSEELCLLLNKTECNYLLVENNEQEIRKIETGKKQFFAYGETDFLEKVGNFLPKSINRIDYYSLKNLLLIFGENNFLNNDAMFINAKNIEWDKKDELFLKPIHDKNFKGKLFNKDTFEKLQVDCDIMVTNPKLINKEYRLFIINRKVVICLLVKEDNQFIYNEDKIEDGAILFAKKMINKFPEKNYIMDIGLIENSYKIIKLNCINDSKFYNSEIIKLVPFI